MMGSGYKSPQCAVNDNSFWVDEESLGKSSGFVKYESSERGECEEVSKGNEDVEKHCGDSKCQE